MDTLLFDELLQEIFHRLPPPSSAAVSLASTRFRRLLRSSTTSLSLHFPPPYIPTTITSLSTYLSHHPFLSSLSLDTTSDGDNLILISASAACPNLRQLRYLSNPVSVLSMYAISTSCTRLSSISVTLSRPVSLNWVRFFGSLKSLSLFFTNPLAEFDEVGVENVGDDFDVELGLESVSLCGIVPGDYGVGFLWRNCKNVKKLELKSCESVGDYAAFSGFAKSISGLKELELRTCRSIVEGMLLKLGENCVSLDSLLVYDGGSRESLLQFINQSKCKLRKLDLRLPLDLDNTNLIALSENESFRGLVSLRLQSCCLVTGEGLKALAKVMSCGLEDLALINCDVVERESGLLASLGQDLKRLRKLDLSYNEMLFDKEIMSMLVSCGFLVELKLRGCTKLSDMTMASMIRNCKQLEIVDVSYCSGIGVKGIELLVMNARRLRQVVVEQSKVSDDARICATNKFIEIVC